MTERVEETRMDPGGLRQGKVRSQEVTTSTLDTPSTFRSISPEKSAQIFTQLGPFCMRHQSAGMPRAGKALSPRRGCKRHGTPTIAEPVPDHRFSATSTGSSIVLLDDALASIGWLQRVFSLECRASSVPVSLFV